MGFPFLIACPALFEPAALNEPVELDAAYLRAMGVEQRGDLRRSGGNAQKEISLRRFPFFIYII